MKIHEMLCEELVKNSQFRSEFLEYARGRVGVFAEGPIAGWPMEGTVEPPAPEPVKVEWRMLLPNETIQKGDQWAPLAYPERWRPVGDSVGRVAGAYRNSHFRRDASLPMTVRESANPSPSATDSVPIVNLGASADGTFEVYEPILVRDEDAERRRAWRLLEPHETVMEGDRHANPYNTDDTCAIGPQWGITAGERSPRWPVIRRIVTERGGYRCPIGSRIMDPEETVPDPSLRNSVHYVSFPHSGERVGDRIIFLLDVVEVPNA